MKTGFATQKVPGGKLLQMSVQCDDVAIRSVQITGDFFVHPEEGVLAIEECLKNLPVSTPIHDIITAVQRTVDEQKLILVGIAPQDIAATLLQSLAMCQACLR